MLSGLVAPLRPEPPAAVEPEAEPSPAAPAKRRGATKQATIQQTLYLAPAVHDQLREVAFAERVKMHALLLEGLDEVFRKRGLKPIEQLAPKS